MQHDILTLFGWNLRITLIKVMKNKFPNETAHVSPIRFAIACEDVIHHLNHCRSQTIFAMCRPISMLPSTSTSSIHYRSMALYLTTTAACTYTSSLEWFIFVTADIRVNFKEEFINALFCAAIDHLSMGCHFYNFAIFLDNG